MANKTIVREKLTEAVTSVLPIALIVLLLCFTIVPVSAELVLSFCIGTVCLMIGMGLFSLGSEMAMTPIGSYMGAKMTKTRKLWFILIISFLLGASITIAEPDLQVLATNVPHIDTTVLILTVSVGVGIFLMICMLRILFNIKYNWLMLGFYGLIFILAFNSDPTFLGVAFDSGGVTTGPMTVPFIMAIGVGVSSIRSDKNAEADSFGLVGLCSVGPILAVLILGFIYKSQSGPVDVISAQDYGNTVNLGLSYVQALPTYLTEIAIALAPIVVFFLIFQVFSLKLRKMPFIRIVIGLVYTFVGLVIFLLGVNVGFSSMGAVLGAELATGWTRWLLIPVAMLMGWNIISAEPAVHVLNKQVEEISAGSISAKAMGLSLSIAVALAMGLSMVRILTGISIFWFLIPGYAIALTLAFIVPQIFTTIAFDSGGVASGPMTAAFMLPFGMGASQALGGNILTDAFGLVAMVAMLPLITIQIMGMVFVIKTRRTEDTSLADTYSDDEIIELWEVV